MAPLQPKPVDMIYQSFDKNLYKITGTEEEDSIFDSLSADPAANNSTNVQTSASDIGSSVQTAIMQTASGSSQQGKKLFTDTVQGYILGVDPKDGFAKFAIGNSTSYMQWDGTNLTVQGNIMGSTIIGGTFETATSGQRVVISSSNNGMILFDSSGNDVFDVGTNGSAIMRVTPYANKTALILQNESGTTSTIGRIFECDVLTPASTSVAAYFQNDGTGDVVQIVSTNNNRALYVSGGASASTADVVHIENSSIGTALRINNTQATGIGIYVNTTYFGNNYQPIYTTTAGTGSCFFQSTSSTSSGSVVDIQSNAAGRVPLQLEQTANTSTHFKFMISLGSVSIWVSDGTSPSGTLSGNFGDLCLNGNAGGHMFWCGGTTTWTVV